MKVLQFLFSVCALHTVSAQVNPLTITPTTPGEFRLDWPGDNQRGFQIEGSPDLQVWTDVGPHTLGTGAAQAMLVSANTDKYFYRLRRTAMRPGFNGVAMTRDDDYNSTSAAIGFSVNYYGTTYSTVTINNNGNLTFNGGFSNWTSTPLMRVYVPMISPFFSDIDTRALDLPEVTNSDVVRYSAGGETANGRTAFGATYKNVGYFDLKSNKLNSFQVIIINRSDTGTGNFDLEYNYDRIEWEASDLYNGGENGIGWNAARVGFTNGEGASGYGDDGLSMEITGSGQSLALLDRDPVSNARTSSGLIYKTLGSTYPGRILIPFRSGYVPGSRFKMEAGPEQNLGANAALSAQLSGSVSLLDPGTVTYEWVQDGGPFNGAAISNPAILNPTVTLNQPGQYLFKLTGKRVVDGIMNFYSQNKVLIRHEGSLTVDAGEDIEIRNVGPTGSAQLLGSATYNGVPAITYGWTQSNGPDTATISNPAIAQPTVTLPAFGEYSFRLTATANGFSRSDEVTILYGDSSNDP